MTGPVERVPLTDEQLALWEAEQRFAVGLIEGGLPTVIDQAWLARTGVLIAELRASRAREQELQQRIDKALAWCREANPSPATNGDQFRDLIAALTGTETSTIDRTAGDGL